MAANLLSENFDQEVAETVQNQVLLGVAGRRCNHAEDTQPADDLGQLANLVLDICQNRQKDLPRFGVGLIR